MPTFAYTARDLAGARTTGTLEATNERDALTQLSQKRLFPLEVKATKNAAKTGLAFFSRVNGTVLANFYAQLGALLKSGVPLLRSLAILRDQARNPKFKEILTDVHSRVEEGTSIGDAMARYRRVFGEMGVNMVRAGGEGGFLEDALERVAAFTEQQEDLKGRTIGALAYPVFLMIAGSGIITFLMVFFVPKFGTIFERLREKGQLPYVTEILLAISETLSTYGVFILVALVILAVVAYTQLGTEKGRYTRDWLKIKIPLIGPVFLSLAVARFCRVLGTLLKNGVPILRSLEIAREAAGNRILDDAIAKASENITAGASLAGPLEKSGHFPRTVVEMISVAEESNTLDQVLVHTAENLESRTIRRLDVVVRLLEPLMLLILAGVVLFVVAGLMLPIMQMGNAL